VEWEDYKAKFIDKKSDVSPPPKDDLSALKTELAKRFSKYDQMLEGFGKQMAVVSEALSKLANPKEDAEDSEDETDDERKKRLKHKLKARNFSVFSLRKPIL